MLVVQLVLIGEEESMETFLESQKKLVDKKVGKLLEVLLIKSLVETLVAQ